MNFNFISSTALFSGCTPQQTKEIVGCLQAVSKSFAKGETIFYAGQILTSFGLVLSGNVSIESHNIWGGTSLLDYVSAGQVFGETYSCIPNQPTMVSAVAACDNTQILFLQIQKLLQPCSCVCAGHSLLIRNLVTITSQKNLNLSRRIFHTSPKTIRERLLSYLSFQSIQQNSTSFSIPFNRQQLADYLSVDRSALSHELSKMQKEGLIDTNKNHFVLHQSPSAF